MPEPPLIAGLYPYTRGGITHPPRFALAEIPESLRVRARCAAVTVRPRGTAREVPSGADLPERSVTRPLEYRDGLLPLVQARQTVHRHARAGRSGSQARLVCGGTRQRRSSEPRAALLTDGLRKPTAVALGKLS